jgi:hypothetical protein
MRKTALRIRLPVALLGAAQVAGQPFKLSPEQVGEIEGKVAAAPEDLGLRSQLLRHYLTERAAEARAARARHLPRNGNYGNAVHEGHRVLGHLDLKAGDVEAAKKHPLEAGKTPGSPQLDSFGPELTLASDLLARGEREAVVEYLRQISRFWKGREEALEEWIILIQAGKTPELNRFRARRSPR